MICNTDVLGWQNEILSQTKLFRFGALGNKDREILGTYFVYFFSICELSQNNLK